MTDFLRDCVGFVTALLPKRTVKYQRDTFWKDNLEVTVGRTIIRYTQDEGVRLAVEVRDYLITPADLVIGGEVIEPDEGDLIFDSGEGVERTYRVIAVEGEIWRYTDRYHTLYRIHTKEVERDLV